MPCTRREFIKKIIISGLSLSIAGTISGCISPTPPTHKPTPAPTQITLYVFDIRKIPITHRCTILSAQGIFNKHMNETGEGIYCIWEHGREFFHKKEEKYTPETQLWLKIYNNSNLTTIKFIKDIKYLLTLSKKYAEGYIIYNPKFIHSINVATTLAGIRNAIIIHPKAENLIKRYISNKIADLRLINSKDWSNDVVKCYQWQYEDLLGDCNKKQIGFNGGFRAEIDYVISNGMCSVALDPSDPEQSDLLMQYYRQIKYYGVNAGYPWTCRLERPMVEHASKAGLRTVLMPSLRGAPFALNYSVHSRMPKAEVHQEVPIEVDYSDDKVYLAFALSDLGLGMLQGFYYDQWYDPFRLSEKRTVKLNWWMDALALDYAPQIVKYYFDTKHPKLDVFYSAHVNGRIRPSDFPNLPDYLMRGREKVRKMGLRVVAFSNHHKWDDYVFKTYSQYLRGYVDGFIYGFGPEFGDIQCKIMYDMPWVFTTFLHHGDPQTAKIVYDYIKKHKNPQFLVYGCVFGYQIPYAKVVQRCQYIYNYLKEKLGNKIVNVNASELMMAVKELHS